MPWSILGVATRFAVVCARASAILIVFVPIVLTALMNCGGGDPVRISTVVLSWFVVAWIAILTSSTSRVSVGNFLLANRSISLARG